MGYKVMYYKTEIEAGKTIEVIKSHTRSLNDHRPREGRAQITPDEMKKINRRNTEPRLARLINANFGYGYFHLVISNR